MKELLKRPILKALALIGIIIGKKFDRELQKDKIHNILIFSFGGIGDKLLLFPVIKTLCAEFPHAQFFILTDPNGADLFDLYPSALLKLITFDINGEHKALGEKIRFLTFIRKSLSIDLLYNAYRGRGMIEHTIMSYMTGATYRIGFTKKGTGFLYTTKVQLEESKPILEQNISLLRAAKIDNMDNNEIDISIPDKDMLFAKNFLEKYNAFETDTIVAIHPTADWEPTLKSWPLKNYIDLIRQLSIHFRVKIIVIGSKKDKFVADQIFDLIEQPNAINAVGQTSISQMAALISCSDLFIGNDSGPLHLSLALNIPSVAIFGATSPKQIISTDVKNCFIVRKNIPCSPCYLHLPFSTPRCKHAKCLSLITVSEVLGAVAKTLPPTCIKKLMSEPKNASQLQSNIHK